MTLLFWTVQILVDVAVLLVLIVVATSAISGRTLPQQWRVVREVAGQWWMKLIAKLDGGAR